MYEGSVRFVEEARRAGLKTAVVSSSANTEQILESAGMQPSLRRARGRRGDRARAPERQARAGLVPPRCASCSESAPEAGAVFEDALAGVAAGRAGGFGLVVGVDRHGESAGAARPRRRHRGERPGGAGGVTDGSRHPVEPWALVEEGVDIDRLAQAESLFALSNGHIGLRGNLDEGEPAGLSGTYLNGFYESFPLEYGERGYGFAEDGQSVVNVTDGKIIRLQVEDEPLDVHRGEVLHHERRLDFRSGLLERRLHWRAASGHEVKLTTRRLVSFSLRSLVRDRVRGGGGGPADPHRHPVEPPGEQGGRRPGRRPAPGQGAARRAALAAVGGPRQARGARARDQALEPGHGVGDGARGGAPRRGEHAHPVGARPRTRHALGRARAGPPAPPVQAAGVPLVLAAERGLASGSGGREPRERPGRGLRGARRGAAQGARPLLAARRHRGGGRRGAAAGAALRDVPRIPGGGAQRGARDPGQGAHRERIRRPCVLGHRELRAAGAHLHRAADGAQRPRVAPLHARLGARARPPARPARRGPAVAHDPRRGVLRVLARGHGRLPRERRGGGGGAALRGGHGRPRVRAAHRLRAARGDRQAVGEPRVSRRARRLPDRRGDRARRVLRAGRQQRLHEPDGAAEPALGRGGHRAPSRGRRRASG